MNELVKLHLVNAVSLRVRKLSHDANAAKHPLAQPGSHLSFAHTSLQPRHTSDTVCG